MILKKGAIEKLSKRLNFPFTGVEQDWAVEFADPKRLNEFIKYYQEEGLNQDEKIALMALILSSYNDLLDMQDKIQLEFGDQIKKMIIGGAVDFSELINYWSLEDETETEMLFKITPFVRQIKAGNGTEQLLAIFQCIIY